MTAVKKVIMAALVLMLGLAAHAAGVEDPDLAVVVGSVTSVVSTGISSPVTIGCGSILAGFALPPCPTTTGLSIGGNVFGSTHTANTTSITVITATQPPVTRTQTISQILTETVSDTMTTATALCYVGASDDGILASCTATEVGPIATNSSPVTSPATSLYPNELLRILAAAIFWKPTTANNVYRHAHAFVHTHPHPMIERRSMERSCILTIFFSILAGICGTTFIVAMSIVCWLNYYDLPQNRIAGLTALFSATACIVLVGEAYAHRGHC